MKGLNKERRQSPQNRMSTSAPQNAAPKQVDQKQMQKIFTSGDGMKWESLPLFSKEYKNREITDSDGTISILL